LAKHDAAYATAVTLSEENVLSVTTGSVSRRSGFVHTTISDFDIVAYCNRRPMGLCAQPLDSGDFFFEPEIDGSLAC